MRSRLLAIGLALACAAVPVMAAAPGNEAEWTRAVQRRLISRLDYPKEAHRLSGPISLSLKIDLRAGWVRAGQPFEVKNRGFSPGFPSQRRAAGVNSGG